MGGVNAGDILIPCSWNWIFNQAIFLLQSCKYLQTRDVGFYHATIFMNKCILIGNETCMAKKQTDLYEN